MCCSSASENNYCFPEWGKVGNMVFRIESHGFPYCFLMLKHKVHNVLLSIGSIPNMYVYSSMYLFGYTL